MESWACGGRREHRSLDLGLQAVGPSDAGPLKEQKTLLSAEIASLQPLHVILIRHPVKELKSIIISLSKELKENIAIMNEQRDWLYKNQSYCLTISRHTL